eukprot:SAG11_NODE_7178_length_1183_cov_0.668819_3_plen_157_part_01
MCKADGPSYGVQDQVPMQVISVLLPVFAPPGLWLDDYNEVDDFYRAQEALIRATAAAYADAGVPLTELFARFAEARASLLVHSEALLHTARSVRVGSTAYIFFRFGQEPMFRFFHPSLLFPADLNALSLAVSLLKQAATAIISTTLHCIYAKLSQSL